jgi:hypothetical protein
MDLFHLAVDLLEQRKLLIICLLHQFLPSQLLLAQAGHNDRLDLFVHLNRPRSLIHLLQHAGVLVVHLESYNVV